MLFLSFSSRDQSIADRLVADLSTAGLDIWYSPTQVNTGENYAAQISRAIRNCDAFLLVFSDNVNQSVHIVRELEMAIAHRKLIYPLRISDDMPTGAIEYYLSGVQYKDLYIDYDAQLRALVSHIKSGDDLQSSIKPTTQVKTTSETVNAENEFTIIQCADIRQIEHLLEGSIAIDRQSYQDELVGIMDRCIEWYYANPEIYTFATDAAGRTIGYINAMPVEEEIYQRIRDGDYLDNEIPPEAIMQFAFPGEFDLYFCSIGVDAYYRNSRLFRVLFDAFISKITRWCDDGYFARRVISDAVTRDGLKMCNVIGCRKLTNSSHNSSIFELSMLPPEIKPTTATVRALISRYEVYGLV